jgi:hypothetical protein
MKSQETSKRGNKYVQVYCSPDGWTRAFPMKRKSEAHETLSLLFARDGVPNVMIMDGAREQVMGEFRRKCRQAGVHVRQTEPPFSNAAESAIRELKKGVARQMVRAKTPKVLWDHCVERKALVRSNTAHDLYQLNGQVPETLVNGETPDITTIAEFQWYEWVKFRDTAISFPEDTILLGRDLGPAIDIGPAHTRKILKSNGQIVYRSMVRSLTPDEWKSPDEEKARSTFDAAILEKLGEPTTWEDLNDDPELDTPILDGYQDDSGGTGPKRDDEEEATPDTFDQYIGAGVMLPKEDGSGEGRVKWRKRNSNGQLVGRANQNPVLDTRVYTVEFPDGKEKEYAANVIAEHMYSITDSEGNQTLLLAEIVGHRKDGHAVDKADQYVFRRGKRKLRKTTTTGWHLCVEWRDGSTSWERLADVKESYPTEVAEYAITHDIHEEPAFAWWVHETIKTRNRIIAAIKQRRNKKNKKFGIKIPRTWEEAVRFDKENGDTQWQDAIRTEMSKVRIAFKILGEDEKVPPGYQQIRCHIIFDIKIEDFRRKARLVAGGHTTDAPPVLTYSSVVSRESVRIAFTIAALNALQVKSSDIENAYLTAPASEKIWTVLGPEFGEDAGKKRALIVRSLYGLKSSGASFRNHLADCMRHLGWQSCLADPDVWIKSEVRPSDGFKYYAYALLYVDDALMIHHDTTAALNEIDHYFKMKPGSIGDPDFYLGAKLRPVTLPNGVIAWGMSPM